MVFDGRLTMARPKEGCSTIRAKDQKLAYTLISRSTYLVLSIGRAKVQGCSVLFDSLKSVLGHSFIPSLGSKAYIRLLYILVHG